MTFPARACVCLAFMAAAQCFAAINPEEFKKIASDVVKVREIARVIAHDDRVAPHIQRITIVGEVTETARAQSLVRDHTVLVIDYAIDLAARDEARKAYAVKNRGMVGRQFMYEPDAPPLDAQGEFWAHLAPLGERLGNVNRYAGAVVFGSEKHGPVFVPVAGQYSWDPPAATRTSAEPETVATFTGTVQTGVMAIGGETTGIVLKTTAGTFELEARGDKTLLARLQALDGQPVTIVGELHTQKGIEVKVRRIIHVRQIVVRK